MQPNVSITIPCRNEEKYIEKCILSILSADYPQDKIKIFVCDGLSTDNTRAIVSNLSIKHGNIELIDNKKQTTPFALNLGLRASNCAIKIILGAHAEIDKDFIKNNISVLNDYPEVGCAGGIIENVYENESAKTIGQAMSSSFGVGNAHFRTGNKNGFVDTVAFGAYRAEVFEKIGYFDEDLIRNQDDEFNFRLLKNGFKIYLNSNIKSKYYVRASFSKLYKQYYQYGYWKVYVNKKHKAVTSIRQLVPLFFVLFLFLGFTLSFLHWILGILFSLGVLAYMVLAIVFASQKSNSFKKMIGITYTFFLLHFSYGLGYLVGIFDFIALNKGPRNSSQKLTR
jgi:cellulose synthase/poly-beta-1,6-N-acetylglucosamine synthase-like glycosyltransferase